MPELSNKLILRIKRCFTPRIVRVPLPFDVFGANAVDTIDAMESCDTSLTQKRSQVRVLFRPQIENEPLDIPVEWFLSMLRFEQRGKLDQLGIEIGSFD